MCYVDAERRVEAVGGRVVSDSVPAAGRSAGGPGLAGRSAAGGGQTRRSEWLGGVHRVSGVRVGRGVFGDRKYLERYCVVCSAKWWYC